MTQMAGISPNEWARRYRSLRPQYERFAGKLKSLLEDLLQARDIKFQVVEARAKTIDSFAEKLERGGKAYAEPLQEMTDLTGARVLVYYSSDVPIVSELVDAEFAVDKYRSVDKAAALAPDQFGYLSVHKIVRLSPVRAKLLEWQDIGGLTAEIQIRSVLQHSWAAISHALQYKKESDVPAQFRRRLSRVSGLLELADQEFGALRDEQASFSATVAQQVSGGDLEISVDAVTMREFASRSDLFQQLGRAASAAGLQVTPLDANDAGVSHLAQAAALLSIETIAALAMRLSEGIAKAPEYFKAFVKLEKSVVVTMGSAAHFASVLLIGLYGANISLAKLKSLGWSDGYLRSAKRAGSTMVGNK